MNEWNSFLTEKGHTKETFAALDADKMAELTSEFQTKQLDAVKDAVAKSLKADDVTKQIEEGIKGLANQKAIDDLIAIVKTQGETLTKMKNKEGVQDEKAQSISQAFKSAIEADKEAFNSIKDNMNAGLSTTTKAAGTILVSTNTTGRVASYERDTERSKVQRRNPFLLELVNVSSTNAANITYVEQVSPDGAPAMTAEGVIKPLIDFDYIERTAAVKKMTAAAKMSKEMMDDVDGFVSDTEAELIERLELLFDEQILSGTGTGTDLIGIEVNAIPFAAGSLALSVEQANNFDVIRVASNQIRLNNFDATVALVNPSDAAQMDLTKATDGHYVMPPFTSADGTVIKGIRIIENNGITAGDFIVGDLSRFKVKVRETLNISYGHSDNDFRLNLLTALCEGRAVAYIPTNYFGAIVKGTFTAAKAALETI